MRLRAWAMALVMLVGLVTVVNVAEAPRAYACDCADVKFEELVDKVDVIAEVTVTDVATFEGEKGRDYQLKVNKVWKGDDAPTAILTTRDETVSCGLGRIPQGETFMLWGHGGAGRYSTGWCSLPREPKVEYLPKLDEMLGQPQVPAGGADPVTTTSSLPPISLGVALLILRLLLGL